MSNIDTDKEILEKIMEVSDQRSMGNFNNMLPVAVVDIPINILRNCPMERRELHRVRNCKGCAWFNGVVQTTYNDKTEMQFNEKYAINCGFPVDRKCTSIGD